MRADECVQGKHAVHYSDGDVEQLNLSNEKWQLVEPSTAGEAAPVGLQAAVANQETLGAAPAQHMGTAHAIAQMQPQSVEDGAKTEILTADGRLPASAAEAAPQQADTEVSGCSL